MITNDIETFYKNMEIHDKRKIERLEQENKQLKEDLKDACYVIEKIKKEKQKAREYIKNASYFDGSSMCANDLLEILGDKE